MGILPNDQQVTSLFAICLDLIRYLPCLFPWKSLHIVSAIPWRWATVFLEAFSGRDYISLWLLLKKRPVHSISIPSINFLADQCVRHGNPKGTCLENLLRWRHSIRNSLHSRNSIDCMVSGQPAHLGDRWLLSLYYPRIFQALNDFGKIMNMEQTDPGRRHSQARDQILVHQGPLVFHADTHLMSLFSLVEMTTHTGKITETKQKAFAFQI